ncbi:MAG: SDR family oxidoreductase [Actinomycetes bacterium]
MDLGLRERVYIVTGATRGLGRAAADALVADGARVVVSSRDASAVQVAVGELGGAERAVGVAADNADDATPDRLVAAARDSFRRLDGALISVGGPPAGDVMSVTDEQWRTSFDSVFLGAVRLARTVASVVGAGGAVGLVLSTSVRSPIGGLAISNGLRLGLGMLAKTLADELGPRGVRVFGLLPGRISTARTMELTPDEQARRGLAKQIPLRRFGEPAEFGRVAAFLLSPAASYLTGVMIPVDGGALRTL